MPSKKDAQNAVLTILQYISPNNNPEVLANTPKRVIESFEELFGGYSQDPAVELSKSFENKEMGYQGMVLIDKIAFSSTCEHHMLPIRGIASVAYIPDQRVVGLSKICRVVEIIARRLQLQERMTQEIATCIYNSLRPQGVAVKISATHDCMSIRGANKLHADTSTFSFLGKFAHDPELRNNFLISIK